MRKVNSQDEELEEVGFDHRQGFKSGEKSSTSTWAIVFVIVISILFAYYFFDKTYEVKNGQKDGLHALGEQDNEKKEIVYTDQKLADEKQELGDKDKDAGKVDTLQQSTEKTTKIDNKAQQTNSLNNPYADDPEQEYRNRQNLKREEDEERQRQIIKQDQLKKAEQQKANKKAGYVDQQYNEKREHPWQGQEQTETENKQTAQVQQQKKQQSTEQTKPAENVIAQPNKKPENPQQQTAKPTSIKQNKQAITKQQNVLKPSEDINLKQKQGIKIIDDVDSNTKTQDHSTSKQPIVNIQQAGQKQPKEEQNKKQTASIVQALQTKDQSIEKSQTQLDKSQSVDTNTEQKLNDKSNEKVGQIEKNKEESKIATTAQENKINTDAVIVDQSKTKQSTENLNKVEQKTEDKVAELPIDTTGDVKNIENKQKLKGQTEAGKTPTAQKDDANTVVNEKTKQEVTNLQNKKNQDKNNLNTPIKTEQVTGINVVTKENVETSKIIAQPQAQPTINKKTLTQNQNELDNLKHDESSILIKQKTGKQDKSEGETNKISEQKDKQLTASGLEDKTTKTNINREQNIKKQDINLDDKSKTTKQKSTSLDQIPIQTIDTPTLQLSAKQKKSQEQAKIESKDTKQDQQIKDKDGDGDTKNDKSLNKDEKIIQKEDKPQDLANKIKSILAAGDSSQLFLDNKKLMELVDALNKAKQFDKSNNKNIEIKQTQKTEKPIENNVPTNQKQTKDKLSAQVVSTEIGNKVEKAVKQANQEDDTKDKQVAEIQDKKPQIQISSKQKQLNPFSKQQATTSTSTIKITDISKIQDKLPKLETKQSDLLSLNKPEDVQNSKKLDNLQKDLKATLSDGDLKDKLNNVKLQNPLTKQSEIKEKIQKLISARPEQIIPNQQQQEKDKKLFENINSEDNKINPTKTEQTKITKVANDESTALKTESTQISGNEKVDEQKNALPVKQQDIQATTVIQNPEEINKIVGESKPPIEDQKKENKKQDKTQKAQAEVEKSKEAIEQKKKEEQKIEIFNKADNAY